MGVLPDSSCCCQAAPAQHPQLLQHHQLLQQLYAVADDTALRSTVKCSTLPLCRSRRVLLGFEFAELVEALVCILLMHARL